MSSEPIAIGFIGAGSICRQRHLPGLKEVDGVRILTVCNRSEQSARRAAEEFGIDHVDTDWQALVCRDDLDAVFIGTWPYMHRDMSIAALEAGKHVFCQARMAMNLDEAKAMSAAADAHPHLVNMISPCPWPLEHYLRQIVQSAQLGQITSVELMVVNGTNLDRTRVHWRERADYSGKQAMAMGIYAETLNALVGPYDRLRAETAIPVPTKTDQTGRQVRIRVPQIVMITGRLENGALAVEHHNSLAVDNTSHTMCLTIRGLEGTVRYDFADLLELALAGKDLQPVRVPASQRTRWTVEQDFVEAVRAARRGKPPEARPLRPDFREGLLYMRKVEAVHLSAQAGQAVSPAAL